MSERFQRRLMSTLGDVTSELKQTTHARATSMSERHPEGVTCG